MKPIELANPVYTEVTYSRAKPDTSITPKEGQVFEQDNHTCLQRRIADLEFRVDRLVAEGNNRIDKIDKRVWHLEVPIRSNYFAPPSECTCSSRKREEEAGLIWWNDGKKEAFAQFVRPPSTGIAYQRVNLCIHCNLPIRRSLLEEKP
jgi:hypothetical protein